MQPTRLFWGKQGSTVSMLLVKPTQVATQGVGIVLYGPEKDLSQPRYAGWAESGTMVWKASCKSLRSHAHSHRWSLQGIIHRAEPLVHRDPVCLGLALVGRHLGSRSDISA